VTKGCFLLPSQVSLVTIQSHHSDIVDVLISNAPVTEFKINRPSFVAKCKKLNKQKFTLYDKHGS
jgi:hypothetical protein